MIKYLLLALFLSVFSLSTVGAENCNGYLAVFGNDLIYPTNGGVPIGGTIVCAPNYKQYLPLNKQNNLICGCWWDGCKWNDKPATSSGTLKKPLCYWADCSSSDAPPCKKSGNN